MPLHLGLARLRPTAVRPALPSLSAYAAVRPASTTPSVPTEDPKVKATSILDAIPGNSLVSKSAVLSSAAGLSIYALSNEYYVVNEETVVAFCLISVWTALIKYGGPVYKSWAESQNEKIKNILNAARADHSQAVKTRIANVEQMSGVIDITKSLFAVSKETATLEAKAFELEQKTAIAAEAKAVLDSWVRYESQVKQRQQRELAQSVIAKVTKELENPKSLQQILQQAVSDVESTSVFLCIFCVFSVGPITMLTSYYRDRCRQGINDLSNPTERPPCRQTMAPR